MRKLSGIFDGLLVLYYRGGDQKALEMLVKRHHSRLCRHAFWYTGDIEASKDIVQDSWRVILLKLGSLKDPDKFGSWAMTIVTRKSLDHLKRVKQRREELRVGLSERVRMSAEENEENTSRITILKVAMKKLPRGQQGVLRLFYIEGLTLSEISQILGLPVGTVKSRLYHAREHLKKLLNIKRHEKRNRRN